MITKLQFNLKNLLGYLITPLMLISIGFLTNLVQDYWKQRWPDTTSALAITGILLLLLMAGLFYISLQKYQLQHNGTAMPLWSKQSRSLIWNNFLIVTLAILLGSVIAITGNLLLPWLKAAFDQPTMTVTLFLVIVMLAMADYFSYRRRSAGLWLVTGIVAFGGGFWQPVIANAVLLLFMTVYSLKLFYLVSRHLIRPYNKLEGQTLSPKTHLMLFLSPLADHYLSTNGTAGQPPPLLQAIESNKAHWQSMDKEALKSDISWEMAYRAIHSQLVLADGRPSRLQYVIVALSAGGSSSGNSQPKGSAGMIKDFVEGLRYLLTLWHVKQTPRILLLLRSGTAANHGFALEQYQHDKNYSALGINSSSFEETSAAVFFAVNRLISQRVTESDIVIDITSWQKNTSVAGALVATVTDVQNQYIDTNNKTIASYDFTFNDFTKLT